MKVCIQCQGQGSQTLTKEGHNTVVESQMFFGDGLQLIL